MKGSCCWPRFKKFALIILPFPRFLNDENAADYVDAIACGFCKTNLTKGKEIEVEDWYLLSHCKHPNLKNISDFPPCRSHFLLIHFTGKSLSEALLFAEHDVYKKISECQKQFLYTTCSPQVWAWNFHLLNL